MATSTLPTPQQLEPLVDSILYRFYFKFLAKHGLHVPLGLTAEIAKEVAREDWQSVRPA